MKKLTIKEQINVTNYQEKFLEWLEKNPDKKKDLIEWEDLSKVIDNDETNKTNCLVIDISETLALDREWQGTENNFLEYWKTLFWWATTEGHGLGLSDSFHVWNDFIRSKSKQDEKIKQLETEVVKLKEELALEREIKRTITEKVAEQLTNSLQILKEQTEAQVQILSK